MKSKFLRALLSAVIAIAIWGYVVTTVSPNSDKTYSNVPVTIQNEEALFERGLMITSTDHSTVDLKLEGDRAVLNKISSATIIVTMDVSGIRKAGVHQVPYSIAYPGDIAQNSLSVLSMEPNYISVTVEDRISKTVPVDIDYMGTTAAENYEVDKENKELDYDSVSIAGPKSVIDQISMARIYVDLTGHTETIRGEYEITLCDKNGEAVDAAMVTTDRAAVNLTLRIARVKQIDLILNVIYAGGATKDNTKITMERETIEISGSDKLLEGMDSLEIGTLNLGLIDADTTQTFEVKLPDGITNVTGDNEITVDIAFSDLAIKTLTVTNFTMVNVPAGKEAELRTEALEVQIRGPVDGIELLEPDTLTAQVDFTGAELGNIQVKVTITCSNPAFGAIGTYTVSATVREANS